MVESSALQNITEMIAETRRLFYDDQPFKAYKNLKLLEENFVESSEVREFAKSEEM
jgi:hypothetical protein